MLSFACHHTEIANFSKIKKLRDTTAAPLDDLQKRIIMRNFHFYILTSNSQCAYSASDINSARNKN